MTLFEDLMRRVARVGPGSEAAPTPTPSQEATVATTVKDIVPDTQTGGTSVPTPPTGSNTVTVTGEPIVLPFAPPTGQINLADCVEVSNHIIDKSYVKDSMMAVPDTKLTFRNASSVLEIFVILKSVAGISYTPDSFLLLPLQSREVVLSLDTAQINTLPEGVTTFNTVMQLSTNTVVYNLPPGLQPTTGSAPGIEVPLGTWLEERFAGSPGYYGKTPIEVVFSRPPISTTNVQTINYPRNFPQFTSARWRGYFNLEGGTYKMEMSTDDGMRAYVDDVLVMNKFWDQKASYYHENIVITPGLHSLRVEYYNDADRGVAAFSMTKVG